MEHWRTIEGVEVPAFIYGTAWKEAVTQELIELAIVQGFRGIDTANQRKHYDEAAVGRAIATAMASGQITRDDLFLQTKYTSRGDRIIGCRTIRHRLSLSKWRSRLPVHCRTWASNGSTRISCMVLAKVWDLARTTGRLGRQWRRSMKAVARGYLG